MVSPCRKISPGLSGDKGAQSIERTEVTNDMFRTPGTLGSIREQVRKLNREAGSTSWKSWHSEALESNNIIEIAQLRV